MHSSALISYKTYLEICKTLSTSVYKHCIDSTECKILRGKTLADQKKTEKCHQIQIEINYTVTLRRPSSLRCIILQYKGSIVVQSAHPDQMCVWHFEGERISCFNDTFTSKTNYSARHFHFSLWMLTKETTFGMLFRSSSAN